MTPSFDAEFNPPSIPVPKVFAKLVIGGVTYFDWIDIEVSRAKGDNNTISTFSAKLDNYYGEVANTFNVNDEVEIYAEKNTSPPTIKIFSGVVGDITFEGDPNKGTLELEGKDFMTRLKDATVEPTVYTNQEISLIVKDIISQYVEDITVVNVQATSVILQRQPFNHLNAFDAIKMLAELAGFTFWVDVDKDLHFVPIDETSSGVTIDNSNTIRSNFTETDIQLYNQVWVYGDRTLTGAKQSFVADGGSVFTLDNSPHNTEVFVAGSTQPKRGSILDLISTPPSGVDYLVNFDDKEIIFVSGTDFGDNIPASGDTIDIPYQKSIPIAKFARDISSIATYGPKSKVIQDKSIKDPNTAKALMLNTLERNSSPTIMGTVNGEDILTVMPGETVLVNLPNEGVTNKTYGVLEATYKFSKEENNLLSNTTIRLNKRVIQFSDTLKAALLDIRKLQAQDLESSDVLSRLEVGAGSMGVRVSAFTVSTAGVGSDFYVGSPSHPNGWVGSPGSFYVGSHTIDYTVQVTGGEV